MVWSKEFTAVAYDDQDSSSGMRFTGPCTRDARDGTSRAARRFHKDLVPPGGRGALERVAQDVAGPKFLEHVAERADDVAREQGLAPRRFGRLGRNASPIRESASRPQPFSS
jgi:hypothetical protein